MAEEKPIPIKKEQEEQKPKEEGAFGEDPFKFEDEFRIVPNEESMVGRSLKLRDLFTLSGAIASDSTVVTVTAAGSSGNQTDLKSFRIFANEWHVGMCIRVYAAGVITDDGTRTCKLSIGNGLAASHTEWNSMTSTAASATDSPWHLTWTGIVTSLGASGTLEAQMQGDIDRVNKDDPNTATVALNTTGTITLALTADWSANNASNSISIRQFLIEVLY